MFDIGSYLWLIPALPLLAGVVTLFLAFSGSAPLRRHAHWPCLLGTAGACLLSLAVLVSVASEGGIGHHFTYYTWAQVGTGFDVPFSLRADGLSAIMLATVTFVSTLIVIFSIGYMHDDPGYPRFFAEVALFVAAMTLLVSADNFLLLYAGWEGVGLCSYLLIGFWFQKPAAAAAARKAFLVTRLGDVGMLLGIILLWSQAGFALDFDTIFTKLAHGNPFLVGAACLLLFCGAVGKSAQFPLHVWLPDAMEGPTPVSALIHAATMVTAGVYLVARCTPLFVQVHEVQLVVAAIGCFTALLGALIALTQNDLKRVLAYSTISQLGYMFLALGSGVVAAGIFHLFTHAFFKALLFLAAGSVMHAMNGVIDMRRFSGLKQRLPWTRWTFLAGAAALAGFPLLSGFWSKDEILAGALAGPEDSPYTSIYRVLFVVGLFTAGLTAFYATRAYLLTFEGPERIPEEAEHHAHESPRVMTIPLVLLAIGAVGAGWVEPISQTISRLVAGQTLGIHEAAHGLNWMAMGASVVVALAGIGLGWFVYARRPGTAEEIAERVPGLYQLSLNKFHFDELYDALIIKPLEGFAEFCRIIDLYVVDGLVDLVAQIPRLLGVLFRPVQNGLVQFYALAMILGVTVFLLALVSRLKM